MHIPSEIEQIIASQVKAGLYASEAEVMREALRLLALRDRLRKERIGELNGAIEAGLAQAEKGELISAEALEADLDRLFADLEQHSGRL